MISFTDPFARPNAHRPSPGPSALRVGTDIQPVAEVADALDRFGGRYLQRVFTAQEVASCAASPDGLAARFAAKEAVVKALRAGEHAPDLRSIEVVRNPDRSCSVRLHGRAARLAAEAGLEQWELSLSHGGGIATATVIAAAPSTTTKGTR